MTYGNYEGNFLWLVKLLSKYDPLMARIGSKYFSRPSQVSEPWYSESNNSLYAFSYLWRDHNAS